MLGELAIRFLIGGLVVSLFSVVGDTLRPKSFAGIFSSAPSVALATLTLTFVLTGAGEASIEARSMLLGAAALFIYSLSVARLMLRGKAPALLAAGGAWPLWLAVAFGLWATLLRR